MPRDVVALVSVEDFVSAIRVYGDRVHDLLRRRGIGPAEAVEVCEAYALGLLDAVVNAPVTVVDLAGWWFARALELTADDSPGAGAEAGQESISLLAGTQGEGQVRAALTTLPAAERSAVTLRDAYDLPPQAVGVALRRGVDAATLSTANGRLRLVAAYDDIPVPDLSGHAGRTTVDLATLSRLAEGSLEPPRAAPLRRHAASCRACELVLDTLEKGRRLAAGLPIVAMAEDAREAMLDAVETRAQAVLPSHDLVLRAVDEDDDPGPIVSPLLAIVAVAVALILGVLAAVLTRPGASAAPASLSSPSSLPVVQPSFTPTPSALVATTAASPRHSPSTSPSASSDSAGVVTPRNTPTAGRSSPLAAPASISVSPTRGPAGTTIRVTGAGWAPEHRIAVDYQGGDSTSATADASGRFTATVQASGLLGRRTVTARSGHRSATASFDVTL